MNKSKVLFLADFRCYVRTRNLEEFIDDFEDESPATSRDMLGLYNNMLGILYEDRCKLLQPTIDKYIARYSKSLLYSLAGTSMLEFYYYEDLGKAACNGIELVEFVNSELLGEIDEDLISVSIAKNLYKIYSEMAAVLKKYDANF